MQNLKFNCKTEHDKQTRKRMKIASALAHYSRLFSMKTPVFICFSSKFKCKLEVVLLVKLRSKGKVANLPLIEQTNVSLWISAKFGWSHKIKCAEWNLKCPNFVCRFGQVPKIFWQKKTVHGLPELSSPGLYITLCRAMLGKNLKAYDFSKLSCKYRDKKRQSFEANL